MTAAQFRRTILVTGANRGLGREAATQLATAGHRVVLAGRDQASITAAVDPLRQKGLDAHSAVLDVTDAASVATAAAWVQQTFGGLDSLINNAGVLLDGGADITRPDLAAWRQTFEVNLFGVVAVTTAFLPLLISAPAGRIVNVSSVLGSLTLNTQPDTQMGQFAQAYNASKAALNVYTTHLAQALASTAVKVNAAHPGWVKTDMGGADATLEPEIGAQTLVQLATLPNDGPSNSFQHLGQPIPW